MTEKPKQNPQEIQKDTKLALTPEQEKQLQKEKQEVLLLSKLERASLSNEAISSYLKKFHDIDISKYSPEIQKKFAEEIQMVFSEFKDFDESMITRLKSIREGMSFGLEESMSREYYRNLIIGNVIETRISVLQATIETQYGETMKVKGVKVNKTDFTKFQTEIQALDQKHGFNVFDTIIQKLHKTAFGGLNFNPINIQEILKKECIQSGVKYSDELYKEYNKVSQEFVGKNIVFNAKDGNGMIKYKGKGFGFESGGVNGLTYDRLKDIYKDKVEAINIEKMGTADLVILLRVLCGVVPVAGDIVSSIDDPMQAYAGVNFDGSIQKTWEKVLGYSSPVLGVLSIIGVGYGIKVALNSPKYAKVMATITKIVDKLSKNKEMLKDIAKNEKVMNMLETMRVMIKGVDNLLVKIKDSKQLPQDNLPDITKTPKSNDNKRIPKKRPEEIIDKKNVTSNLLDSLKNRINFADKLKKVEGGDEKLYEIQEKLRTMSEDKNVPLHQKMKFLKGMIEEVNLFLRGAKEKTKNIKVIKNTHTSKYIEDNFKDVLSLPEHFNSQEGLEYVRKLTGKKRVEAMKVWKEKLNEQLYVVAQFPTQVKEISEGLDFSKLSKDEIMQMIVRQIQSKFTKLSVEQRKEVLVGIEKFVERKKIVHKYAEDPLYKDNSKKLIADAYGIDISKLQGEVTMEIDGANFTFYIHNSDDYKLLYAYGDEEKARNFPSSSGFASSWSKIPELKGTISVVKGANEGDIWSKGTKIHETRHMENQILMPDHNNGDHLSRAKDEIIAFLKEGRGNIDEISLTLQERGEQALYDYYKDIKNENPKRYKELRKLYEQELQTAISIAERMQKANIPNYLDILAITPVRQWSYLESIYRDLLKYSPDNFHIKMRDKRTVPYIFGEEYTDFSREYQVLEQMYKIAPEYIVKPLEYNNGIGYYVTEKIHGVSLQQFYELFTQNPNMYKRHTKNIDNMFSKLDEIINLLHKNGLVHGDLLGNILVFGDGVNFTFKIIDPVGVKKGDNNYQLLMEKDINDIKSIRQKLLGPISTPVNPRFLTPKKEDRSDLVFETPVNHKIIF